LPGGRRRYIASSATARKGCAPFLPTNDHFVMIAARMQARTGLLRPDFLVGIMLNFYRVRSLPPFLGIAMVTDKFFDTFCKKGE